jgi:hypothetical protein
MAQHLQSQARYTSLLPQPVPRLEHLCLWLARIAFDEQVLMIDPSPAVAGSRVWFHEWTFAIEFMTLYNLLQADSYSVRRERRETFK